jgi:acetyl-CoA carboxylase carboxyltransferase component
MIGGGFHVSFFTVAWALKAMCGLAPTRKKEAIADPVEREKYYKAKVAELCTNGKAVSITSVLEIDEMIDLAETRRWAMAGLQSVPEIAPSPQAALHQR